MPPSSIASRVATSSPAPAVESRPSRSPLVSVGRTASVSVPKHGPVSRPSSMRNVVAPVISSPAMTACWTGAAPRQAGRSEKCRLIQPMPRDVEGRPREQRSVGHDGDRVEIESPQRDLERLLPRVPRVEHREAGGEGALLDRAGAQRPPTAGGRVGAGDDGDDLVAAGEQRVAGRHRGLRGPGEDESHAPERAPNSGCGLALTTGAGSPAHSASRIASMAGPLRRRVEPVDEQDAVEVVGLVLHAPGEQVAALDRDRVAVLVLAVRDDVAPCARSRRSGRAATGSPRRRPVLVVREVQHRVHQVTDLAVDVVGEHPQPDADLRGGQPGARSLHASSRSGP